MARAKKAVSKNPDTSSKSQKSISAPSEQQIYLMIAEAAYFKAERRDFVPGFEYQDWVEAENEVTTTLQS